MSKRNEKREEANMNVRARRSRHAALKFTLAVMFQTLVLIIPKVENLCPFQPLLFYEGKERCNIQPNCLSFSCLHKPLMFITIVKNTEFHIFWTRWFRIFVQI